MQMRLLFVFLLAVDAVAAHASLGPGDTNDIPITVDGLVRQYDVHVPPSYDGSTAVPLVLDLHGYTATPSLQATLSGMKSIADAHGFIVAFPAGYGPPGGLSWNAGICCDPAKADGVDDVAFARAVVADIAAEANIDPLRVYATGLSNGGFMSHRLGCEAADLFAAVAPVAAPLGVAPASCQPLRPMPLLQFSGLTDTILPYAGGPISIFPSLVVIPALDSFAHWASVDGCSGSPDVVDLGNGASLQTHTSCLDGAQVGLYSINGTGSGFLGHILYFNDDSVDVSQGIWDFFTQFTLPPGLTTSTSNTSTSTTSTSTTTTTTLPPGVAIDGAKLVLKDDPANPLKRKATIASKDVDITLGGGNGSADDPRTAGATLRIVSAAGDVFDDTYALPASGWRLLGHEGENKGYKYKDALLAYGPVKAAVLRPGKLLKITAKGNGLYYTLGGNPDPVDVVVTFGGVRYCQRYGGQSTFETPTLFASKSAPAGACPPAP
jgi:polyhydroxybutyrate depolymerase